MRTARADPTGGRASPAGAGQPPPTGHKPTQGPLSYSARHVGKGPPRRNRVHGSVAPGCLRRGEDSIGQPQACQRAIRVIDDANCDNLKEHARPLTTCEGSGETSPLTATPNPADSPPQEPPVSLARSEEQSREFAKQEFHLPSRRFSLLAPIFGTVSVMIYPLIAISIFLGLIAVIFGIMALRVLSIEARTDPRSKPGQSAMATIGISFGALPAV